MPTWKSNPDLMARLRKAQNHPANTGIDIMSFAGMCSSREELQRHVERCENEAAIWQPPVRKGGAQ